MASGGAADGDNAIAARDTHRMGGQGAAGRFDDRGHRAAGTPDGQFSGCLAGGYDFCDQFSFDLDDVGGHTVELFRNVIDCAEFQCLDGITGPFGGERTDHDNRHGIFSHDAPDCFDAVHAGHLDIHRHDVRFQSLDLLNRLLAVSGHTGNCDSGVAGQHRRQSFAHEGRVVDDQHLDGLWHNESYLALHAPGFTPALIR
jgi:hypothetical protein